MPSMLRYPLSPHPLPREKMLLTSKSNDSLLSDAGLVLVAVIKLIESNSGINKDGAMQT